MAFRYKYHVSNAHTLNKKIICLNVKSLSQLKQRIHVEFGVSGQMTVQQPYDETGEGDWVDVDNDQDLPDGGKLRFIHHNALANAGRDQFNIEMKKLENEREIGLQKLDQEFKLKKREIRVQEDTASGNHKVAMQALVNSDKQAMIKLTSDIQLARDRFSAEKAAIDKRLTLEEENMKKMHNLQITEVDNRHRESMAGIQFRAIELKESSRRFDVQQKDYVRLREKEIDSDTFARCVTGVAQAVAIAVNPLAAVALALNAAQPRRLDPSLPPPLTVPALAALPALPDDRHSSLKSAKYLRY